MDMPAWFRRLTSRPGLAASHDAPKVGCFIIGVQKGATTALVEYLREHPSLQIPAIKEVHFFDNEEVDWRRPDYAPFHSYFGWDDPGVLARADATPITAYWPDALERLQRYNPEAKLILILRHPTFRANSHWRMERVHETEPLSFEEAVSEVGRSRVREAPNGAHRSFSYVERGLYAGQVRRLLKLFPRRQVLFLRTEDLWLDTQRTISTVERFFGVPAQLTVESRYIVPVQTRQVGGLAPEVRARLDALFAPDIVETERLTGLDLAHWRRPDYREPMIATSG